MAQSPARILMRVTVDCAHADLLQDLLQHVGRRRARRIVFLAALGKLAEHGAIQGGIATSPPNQSGAASQNMGAIWTNGESLRSIASIPEDVAFLARLREDLP